MKPDWKDAPEWANYLARDSNGEWYWYAYEPKVNEYDEKWISCRASLEKYAGVTDETWKTSLEYRP